MGIASGIVLYEPDLERLMVSIKSILKQVETVYIFDNTPVTNKDFTYQEMLLENYDSIVYLSENENKGIAYALNRIMERAKTDGYSWVITMDQDSVMPEGIVRDYEFHIEYNSGRIAILCPQVIDRRRSYMKIKQEIDEEYIEECITSASCTSVEAWEFIGGFDEWLFIDLVDNEFCKRLIISGFKILRINKWVLDQEFGKIIPKSNRQQNFWIRISELFHNENFAKFSYKKFVSPMRIYYTHRNIIYVNQKLKKYGKTGYQNYNCKNYLGFIICFSVPSILRAQEKGKVLKAIIRGTIDGKRAKVDNWTI